MPDVANFIAQNFVAPDRAAIDRTRYSNALYRNEVARLPQTNRAQDLGLRAAEQQINQRGQQFTDEQKTNARMILSRGFAAIGQSPQPKATALQFISSPDFQAAGNLVGLPVEHFARAAEMSSDDNVRAGSIDWARILGSEVAAAPQSYGDPYAGPDGSMLQRGPDGRVVQVLPREPQQASQAAPDRELVTIEDENGNSKLVPRSEAVGKRPYQRPTGGLSARDATTARNKLTQIRLARQALQDVQISFDALGGGSTGPIGQYRPSEAGESFNTAVDSMRDLITSITRTPGVGAMSDFETRLNQAKMPTRGKWFDANIQQQIDSLQSLIDGLDEGYSGLLSDGGMEPPQNPVASPAPKSGGPAPQSGGWSIRKLP